MTSAVIRGLVPLLVVCAAASTARAQETTFRRVPVRVTAVQVSRAYIDVGSDGGLRIGDRVELFPDGQPMLESVVRGITRNSARLEWSGAGAPEVGTAGEALVPADRPEGPAPAQDHPGWTQPPESFDPELPLLAPVQGLSNWERERHWSGRWFAQGDWTSVDIHGEQQYALARTGVDLSLENPFGKGGALELDGEIYHRSASLWDEGEESRTHGRIDQLSAWWGGVRGKETRYEVGRFLQNEFPEFGLLDGAEITWRTEGGDRFGVSAGLLPELDGTRSSAQDVGVSAYYRHVIGEDEHAAIGIGAQKTWHEGAPDRDLVVINGHWRPGQRWSLYGSAWIDAYTSSDQAKSSGMELTRALASASYRFENGLSLGLSASQYRWPDLARNELPPLTSETLTDGVVTRVGLNASKNVTKALRLSGRVDRWTDQDDSGGNMELRAGLREVLLERGEVSLAVFASGGKYTDLIGLRVGWMDWGEHGTWRLDLETAQAEQRDFGGDQSKLLQHALRGSYDWNLGKGWSLALSAESRFGDEQDSLAAGFFLQRRF